MTLAFSQVEVLQRHLDDARRQIEAGDPAAALVSLETAAAIAPRSAETHFTLALAHRKLRDSATSEKSARLAVELDPNHAPAAHFLGALLAESQNYAQALPWLREATRLSPETPQFHRDLGVVQLFLGDTTQGRDSLLQAAENDLLGDRALYTLARMTDMGEDTPMAHRVFDLLRQAESHAEQMQAGPHIQLMHALAKAHEDRGETDASFDYLMRGAGRKAALVDSQIAEIEAFADNIIAGFDKAFLQRLAGEGALSPRPVFIVGMPRSGSTLVEQILAAHPRVHGAGELNALVTLVDNIRGLNGEVFPHWLGTLNGVDCRNIAEAYLKALPTGSDAEVRTTDKRLDNMFFLGLIAAILPNATLIHCNRDPRDVAFSCLSILFSDGQEWSYSMEGIARYWRVHQRLLAHWRAVLPPGALLEVEYESLVGDIEPWARRIVGHAGLEWDERCLAFYDADRPVTSASMVQVRQPVYDRSIGRWRPYAEKLAPMFEAMGV